MHKTIKSLANKALDVAKRWGSSYSSRTRTRSRSRSGLQQTGRVRPSRARSWRAGSNTSLTGYFAQMLRVEFDLGHSA
jgi:hypothetical protein